MLWAISIFACIVFYCDRWEEWGVGGMVWSGCFLDISTTRSDCKRSFTKPTKEMLKKNNNKKRNIISVDITVRSYFDIRPSKNLSRPCTQIVQINCGFLWQSCFYLLPGDVDHHCEPGMFQCHSSTPDDPDCIAQVLVCDMEPDCRDESDESICSSRSKELVNSEEYPISWHALTRTPPLPPTFSGTNKHQKCRQRDHHNLLRVG